MNKRLRENKKGFNRMLSMLIALMMTIAFVPIGSAVAEDAAVITVSGAGDATAVEVGQTLQMAVTPEDATVTWSVYDANASGEALTTQNNATIDSSGLLTGVQAGYVSVTASTSAGQSDSALITVGPVGAPSPTALGMVQGTAVYLVPLGKVKITVPVSPMITYWATSGEPDAEQTPYVGEFFSDVQDTYTYNISENPFVPASAGDTISIVGKNLIGVETIAYFQTLEVADSNIGSNPPPEALIDTIKISLGSYSSWSNPMNRLFLTDLFREPGSEDMDIFNLQIADPTIATVTNYYIQEGSIYKDYIEFTGLKYGKTTLSFDLCDATDEKVHYTMALEVLRKGIPFKTDNQMPFPSEPIQIYFDPTETDLIPEDFDTIEVNGNAISAEDYSTFSEVSVIDENGHSSMRSGFELNSGVLQAGANTIVFKTEGYLDAAATQFIIDSSDWYYIHTSTDTTNGGLTATAQLVVNIDTEEEFESYGYENQGSIVFQLMNGDEPIDTVSFTTNDIGELGTYHAQFNLANPDYTVKAFLITGDNADDSNLGYNLATEVSQDIFDEKYEEYEDWD